MPVPSQEYDSSCPFVFDVFCYLILPCYHGYYGLFELIFLKFSIFVILLFVYTVGNSLGVSGVSLFSSSSGVFPSVLVCNPNLFSLKRFMTFELRYFTVAFKY